MMESKMTVSIEKRKWLYGMAFLCCILMSVLLRGSMINITLQTDDIGCFFMPATLSGRDWSDLISSTAFYGWLYYMFYTPIFLLSQSPYVLYGLFCLLNIIVMGLIAVLIYHILIQEFDMPKTIWTVFIACISCTYVINYSTRILNELPALLVVWLLAFVLLKAISAKTSNKGRLFYSILVPFLITMSYNIHTRLIVLLPAVAVALFVYYWVYREWYLNPIAFSVTAGCGFGIAYMLKSHIVDVLWRAESVEEVHNATFETGKYLLRLNSTIKVWFDIIISNFFKLCMETRGIAIICAICIFAFIVMLFKRRPSNDASQQSEKEKKIFFLALTFGIALVATMAGLILYYGGRLNALYEQGLTNTAQQSKSLSYIRYYYIYFGPLFISTMVLLKDKLVDAKVLKIRYGVISIVALSLYVFFGIISKIDGNILLEWSKLSQGINVVYYNIWFVSDDIYGVNFWLGVVIVTAQIAFWCLMIKYKKPKLFLLGLLLTVIANGLEVEQGNFFFNMEGASAGDASYELFYMTEQEELLPEDIYYLGSASPRRDIQFMLNWKTIIYSVPESDIEEAIVITSSLEISGTEQLLMDGYTYYQLDADEYIWIKGEELHDKLLPYIQTYWSQSKSISESKITYEDDMYKVGKLLYANGDERSVTAVISNPLDGEYVISVAMDVLRSVDSVIGYADIYVDGALEQTIELTEAYFDDGQQLDLSAYTSQSQSLEVQIRLCQGTLVHDLSFCYQTSDTSKRMGMNRENELEQIEDIMERLDSNLPLYVLHEYNYYSVSADLSTLKEVFSVKDIDVLDITEIDLSKYNKDAYILMENDSDNSMIFELVEHYDILCKTSHYTLLMNRNAENEEAIRQADIFCLSSEGRINVDYFRMTADGYLDNNVTNTLAKNIYLVEIEKNTEETGDSAASLQVMHGSTNILSLTTTADDNMSGTFCLTADTSLSFNWLQQAVDENQGYTVYIMEDIEEFRSGDIISFSDGELGFYYTNLHATENWGVWTSDEITEFVFEYDGKEDVDIEIELKSLVAQTVNAYIDGDYVGSYEVGQTPTIITIPVSKAHVMDGEITLELEGEAVWVASDIVGNADTREVGLGLYSITFKEEQ